MRYLLYCFAVVLMFSAVQSVFAVTLSIVQYPSTFDQGQEIDIDFSLGCSNCGDSYIRGAFYPSGTSYFGFTKNNTGDWIGTATDKTQYFKIGKTDLVGSTWSGKLRVKIDITDGAYSGPGQYSFKIGRYTSADSNPFWSGAVSMTITGPTATNTPSPSPTLTPTSTPEPTVTKTPTPLSSTNIPTSTKKPTNTMTPKVTTEVFMNSQKQEENIANKNEEADILADETSVIASASVLGDKEQSPRTFIITFLFIGTGCALLSVALVLKKHL